MGMTTVEKILANHSDQSKVSPGDVVVVDVDVAVFFDWMRPDVVKIFDPDKLVLLHDQRFIDCVVIRGNKGELIDVRVKRITATGREFLDQAKQPALWKETVAKSGTAEFGEFVRALRDCVEAAAE